ncbi:RNA-binding protein EWS [Microtus ochrogaster]|uniref:RNA-binding protein EWS n=1 Tax=Microtus ochrogaster TaxID=79684 RepID=A0A8J6KKF3_MICOH|nr:RNA-binding protein EWS [Microtus ochrogaster]
MDEGPGPDLGLPIDPDEDSDNSAIYVQGLNDNVTLDDLADFECNQCKDQNLRASTRYPSNLWDVIVAEATVVPCREEKVSLWIVVVLEKCSEVAEVERNVTSEVAIAWTEVDVVEEYDMVLRVFLDH